MLLVHLVFAFLFVLQTPPSRSARVPSSTPGTLVMEVDSAGEPLHSAAQYNNSTSFTVPASVAAFANVIPAAIGRMKSQLSDIEGNVSLVWATPQSFFAARSQANIMSEFRSSLIHSSKWDALRLVAQVLVMFIGFIMFFVASILCCVSVYTLLLS